MPEPGSRRLFRRPKDGCDPIEIPDCASESVDEPTPPETDSGDTGLPLEGVDYWQTYRS